MKLGQAFKMAFKSLAAKKGRSFLTMLGIIIGICSVMTIVSVISGYNQKSIEYYESMGTNKVTAYCYMYNGGSTFDKLYDYCQNLDEYVEGISPESSIWGGTIIYGTKNSNNMDYSPTVYLGSDQYAIVNNFQLAKGRDICALDIDDYKHVCVIGARVAQNFFDFSNPIGETITIGGVPFEVVGVYAEKDPDNDYSLDNIIVIPYTANRYFPDNYNEISECSIKVKDSDSINIVITYITNYMNTLTMDGSIGYGYAYSTASWIAESNELLTMLSLVLGGIAGISLLVGGIGIMNIMLVTVTERTREIGIRRAIGARKSSIVTQFLIEAAMLCAAGGVIGIGIGCILTNIAGRLILQMSMLPSFGITMAAFGFSVVIGVIFGLYPAIKAANLQPVVALRAD